MSNRYRHAEVQKCPEQLRQLAADKQGIPQQQVDMRNMEALLIQQGTYIDASLDEKVTSYGSMENYIRQGLDLSDGEVEHLRDGLLQPSH